MSFQRRAPSAGEGTAAGSSPADPADAEAAPKRKSRKKRLPKVISHAEAVALLDRVAAEPVVGLRNRLILELMYRAGLRVSEAVGVTIRDVERDGLIRLYQAKGGDGTAYFDPARILPLLDRWLDVRAGWAQEDAQRLFVRPDGRPVTVRYVQRLIKRMKAELGIQGKLTPHVLRHTYATELIEEGFSLVEVQSALRHQNLATTSVYLHIRDKALQTKMSHRTEKEY